MEIGLEISKHNFGEIMTLLAHVAELQGIFKVFQGGLTCDKIQTRRLRPKHNRSL